MLRSFRVANHRSIRVEQELALIPAYESPRPVVPVAAIYGANATGKSNLIDAFQFMQEAVRASFTRWEAGTGVPRTPFRLAAAMLGEPSSFVVNLELTEGEYVYGFSVDDTAVVEEWLYRYRESHRKTVIFERAGRAVTLGDSLRERTTRQRLLASALRGNALLLSVAAQVGEQPEFAPVYRWFSKSLRLRQALHPLRRLSLVERVRRAREIYPHYVDLVRAADLDITDVRVEEVEVPLSDADLAYVEQIDEELDTLHELLEVSDDSDDDAGEARRHAERLELAKRRVVGRQRRRELVFVQGGGALMTAADQSTGTIAYIDVLTDVLAVLQGGGVMVVDEIDTSLHPRLLARLIELFHTARTNPHHAQLVFATHDATLLGSSFGEEILRRDEIWFTEKREGATTLYPLTDFHPRKEDNRERRYLGGSYGGVPAVFSDTLVEQLLVAGSEQTDAPT